MNVKEPELSVCLPHHELPEYDQHCFRCGLTMDKCTASMVYTYKGLKVRVANIRLFRCGKCRENIYTSYEAHMIENALRDAVEGGLHDN